MASIYLHIPFCERKCIYCDFYSIENQQLCNNFLNAVHREIDHYIDFTQRDSIETIYIGGGTPSLLTAQDMKKILVHLIQLFSIRSDSEITIEVNPGTVDKEKLTAYLDMGINRLSIGVQSFQQDDLQFLTRIHTVDQAIQTIRSAKEVGFKNISIDLIYAIPNQTLSSWKENIEHAITFEPQHISAYSLIVEENTPLAQMVESKAISPVDLELEAAMYAYTMERLNRAGYDHYEISNYAKPGFQSKHNCNYWNHTNYLGFGPSAHSFWDGKRWWNIADLLSYCEKLSSECTPIAGSETLTIKEMFNEAVMLGLRSGELALREIELKYKIDLAALWNSVLKEMTANGY
ncbi:MAG: radical SAM family heme chaperone HemW, partial [Ignavibacteriales bacterium]|nr:radical SAM family heme chaperone HemW [Ignavibacteriales bacterium]